VSVLLRTSRRTFFGRTFFLSVSLLFCLSAAAQAPSEDPQLANTAAAVNALSSGVTAPGANLAPPATSSPTAAPVQATQTAGPTVVPNAQTQSAIPSSSATPLPSATQLPGAGIPQVGSYPGIASAPGAASTPYVPSDVETYSPSDDVRAVVRTSMGSFTIRLQSSRAPINVANFVALAKGTKPFIDVKTSKKVSRPFYNGLIFHRVLAGHLIQSGCPFGNGHGGPGYTVPDEISPFMKFNKPGVVAMAGGRRGVLTEKDSNGSQFFITVSPQPEWDGKYTVIGEVEKGMDVVQRISKARTGPADKPIHRITILSIDIMKK
jgi:peptidyl-prolyl cis-trans isomerase A (cyclophilin A)